MLPDPITQSPHYCTCTGSCNSVKLTIYTLSRLVYFVLTPFPTYNKSAAEVDFKIIWIISIHQNIITKKNENIVVKVEIACFGQFLLLRHCFQKSSATEASESGKGLNVWKLKTPDNVRQCL